MDAPPIGPLLCIGVPGVFILSVLAGALLRAACTLYNYLHRTPESVQGVTEPPMLKAMGIMAMVFVTHVAVQLLGRYLVLTPIRLAGGTDFEVRLLTQLVGAPITYLLLATLLMLLLPTTFGRAAVVSGLMYLICFVVLGGLMLVMVAVDLLGQR